jgi:anthranilate phosphoribosyltransferase
VTEGEVRTWTLEPAKYGLAWERVEDLAGGEPKYNAERVERLLDSGGAVTRSGSGEEAARRAAVLNAAAGLLVSGLAESYAEATGMAAAALTSGRAMNVLERLRRAE